MPARPASASGPTSKPARPACSGGPTSSLWIWPVRLHWQGPRLVAAAFPILPSSASPHHLIHIIRQSLRNLYMCLAAFMMGVVVPSVRASVDCPPPPPPLDAPARTFHALPLSIWPCCNTTPPVERTFPPPGCLGDPVNNGA